MTYFLNQPHQKGPEIAKRIDATHTSRSYHWKSINVTMSLIFGIVTRNWFTFRKISRSIIFHWSLLLGRGVLRYRNTLYYRRKRWYVMRYYQRAHKSQKLVSSKVPSKIENQDRSKILFFWIRNK